VDGEDTEGRAVRIRQLDRAVVKPTRDSRCASHRVVGHVDRVDK
jgi:hypothetical protein